MAKKLRDSASVNELVMYRNLCEEKKLKFTLSQLENLKTIYSRQKEQEKMFFAVQHMAVPIKTNSVIMNLRKNLGLEEIKASKSSSSRLSSVLKQSQEGSDSARTTSIHSRVTFRDEIRVNNARSSVHSIHEVKTNSDNGLSRTETPNIVKNNSRKVSGPSWSKPVNQKFKHFGTPKSHSNNPKNNVRSSIRVISPHPKRPGEGKVDTISGSPGKKGMVFAGVSTAVSSSVDRKDEQEQASNKSDILDEKYETTANDTRENSSSLLESLEAKVFERSSSTWSKDGRSRRSRFAPRLTDLPPVNINIYENPCSEKESKEKWQKLVHNLRNSRIEETRTESELLKYNQEVRTKWQNTYYEMKRDRISAMVKDKMKMVEGEQLTLVKFLPKSRQSLFIKEAQLAQHRV